MKQMDRHSMCERSERGSAAMLGQHSGPRQHAEGTAGLRQNAIQAEDATTANETAGDRSSNRNDLESRRWDTSHNVQSAQRARRHSTAANKQGQRRNGDTRRREWQHPKARIVTSLLDTAGQTTRCNATADQQARSAPMQSAQDEHKRRDSRGDSLVDLRVQQDVNDLLLDQVRKQVVRTHPCLREHAQNRRKRDTA